jgi:hypothetical protein
MAAHLALLGFPTTLYNRTPDHIAAIKELGGIDLDSYDGGPHGFGRLACITSSIAEALDQAVMIMVVVPSSAHAEIAKACAPYLRDGHVVVLHPGRTCGAIEFANRTYWEKKTPGWKTDRGRVFAKNGAPDELLHREQEQRAPPYEVWKYARSGEWYIFADLTGIDNWKLMTSTDLRETRIPDWRNRLGEDAVRDAGRFLQVDFYSDSMRY